MGFLKKENIYRITRITGTQDNILGVAFDDKDRSDNNIEVIEWDFSNIDKSRIRTSKRRSFRTSSFRIGVGQSISWNKL